MKRAFLLCLILLIVLTTLLPTGVAQAASIQIGQYIYLGNYYGEPIKWRCVDIDENGPLMLADRILCLKAFDASGSNVNLAQQKNPYNPMGSHQRGYNSGSSRKDKGSNYWGDSTLRCWLNSRAGAGQVVFTCGNPPDKAHVVGGYNAYDQEAGFLTNFTDSELAAMKTVSHRVLLDRDEYNDMSPYGETYHKWDYHIATCVQNFDKAYAEVVTDTVFLPDVKQINKVWQNLGNYYIGYPTASCVKRSEYKPSSLSTTTHWDSWLGSPCANVLNGRCVRYVDSGGNLDDDDSGYYSASYCRGGVRPAFYLHLTSSRFVSGDGTFEWPYTVVGSGKITAGQSESNVSATDSPAYQTDGDRVLDRLKIDTDRMLSNLKVMNDTVRGPSVTFLGKTFYLFEMGGKVELDLKDAGVPVSVKTDLDKKTARILIGFHDYSGKADISADANKSAYWSESYQQVKKLYTELTGKKVDTTRLWNRYSSLRGQLKQFDSSLLVNAKCQVAGFVELNFETGEVRLSEGGMILSASIGGEFTGRIPAFPAAYAVLGLTASADGSFALAYSQPQLDVKADMDLGLTANVGVGLGSKKAKTYLEGGLKGKLGVLTHFATGKFAAQYASNSPVIVTVSGNVYLKGSFLGFLNGSKDWPIGSPLQLYPWNGGAQLSSLSLFGTDSFEEMAADSVPLPRDYLHSFALFSSSIGEDDKIYSDTSVYPYNSPSLATLPDGRILLMWIDDTGKKSDINKTSLMYSVYDGTGWSQAAELFETGGYNGDPVLCRLGDRISVLWTKTPGALEDSVGLNGLMTETELYSSSFDGSAFSEPVRLTDNRSLELNYALAESEEATAAAWVENSNNNAYMTDGVNSIVVREKRGGVWGEPITAATSSLAIDEVTPFYENGALNVAYSVIAADGTTQVYLNGNKIADGGYLNYQDGFLYYLSENTVMAYSLQTKTAEPTALTGVNHFSVKDGRAFTLVQNGWNCELYEATGSGTEFSDWKQITAFDRYIRDYDVAFDASGDAVYALNLVETNEEGGDLYGSAELCVCYPCVIHDLALSALYFDDAAIEPGKKLEVGLDVTNNGTETVSGVTVRFRNKAGKELLDQTANVTVAPGQTQTVTVEYSLPQTIALTELTAEVSAQTADDAPEDNAQVFSYGLGDAAVSDLSVERCDGGAVLRGTVSNEGYTRLSNVSVYLTDPGDTATRLDTLAIGTLAAKSETEFALPVPQEYLTLEDKMTMNGLKVFVETTGEETNYANNDDKIVFGDLSERSVVLCDGTEIIDIISWKDFNTYRYRKDGYRFNGWYDGEGVLYRTIDEEPQEDLVLVADFSEGEEDVSVWSFLSERVKNGVRAILDLDYTRKDFDAYYAVYDENGTMIASDTKKVSAGQETVEFASAASLENKYYTTKLFLWNEDMSPLMKPLEEILYLNERFDSGVFFETDHDYPKNYDHTFAYHYDGLCRSLSVTFTPETETEADADFIEIYDKDDTLVASYSGTAAAGKTVTVNGDTVKIKMTSDSTLQAYGFKTKTIIVNR